MSVFSPSEKNEVSESLLMYWEYLELGKAG